MKEIAYNILPPSSENGYQLCLSLIEVKKELYTFDIIQPLSLQSLDERFLSKHSPTDREILKFLLPFREGNQLTIPLRKTEEVLKKIEATQKLFFQDRQLIVDLFGKVDLYYVVHLLDHSSLKVEAYLRWNSKESSLSSCDAIGQGNPCWFIKGMQLKWVQTEELWKDLIPFIAGPVVLEGEKKHRFLDSKDPAVLLFPKSSLEEAQEIETPHPVLQLTDRWGACADLWMDYGKSGIIPLHEVHSKKDFRRNFSAETLWEHDLLETDYIKKMVGHSHYYCPLDATAKSLSFLLELGWKIKDCQGRQLLKHTGLDLEIKESSNNLLIKGKLNYDSFETQIQDVIGSFNRREQFISLSEDTVGLLPHDQEALFQLAEEGECLSDSIKIKKAHLGTLDSVWTYVSNKENYLSLKEKWKDFKKIEEHLPSKNFQGILRPYQQLGLNWLCFLKEYGFNGILADDMGLGKTVQILAFLSTLPKTAPHLIVMPTSLLFNWKNEIEKFLPSFVYRVHQGAERNKEQKSLESVNIILTSYTTLRNDLPLFLSIPFSSIILDEAQVIKNAQTQTAQSVYKIQSDFRLCITGTPVENHQKEMWSHFHFLMPELLGSQDHFEAQLKAGTSDARYLEKIRRKIAPFILRRKKEEVLQDLPERIDQIVWIEMEEEQKRIYDQLLAGFKTGLLKKISLEGIKKHRLAIFEAILRLRQVCCHPYLVSSLTEMTSHKSGKFEAFLQDVETLIEEGQKILVYSQFTSMLQIMTKFAREKNWSFGYLDGATKNREEVVQKFQNDPEQSLFFVSLKAGGVGLNLTAADAVLLYDPWWNDAIEEQAINRAHRIGRKAPVLAKRFITIDSIEEKILKLKKNKGERIAQLFEGNEDLESLTPEDLLDLLEPSSTF